MKHLVFHFDMNKYSCFFDKWFEQKDGKRIESKGPSFPKDYTQVAEVDADCLDSAYRLTNNIEDSWTYNEEVKTDLNNARSTSVGDIIIPYSGQKFIVASCGFKEIN